MLKEKKTAYLIFCTENILFKNDYEMKTFFNKRRQSKGPAMRLSLEKVLKDVL